MWKNRPMVDLRTRGRKVACMTKILHVLIAGVGVGLFIASAGADVSVPPIFGNHMVLQRGREVPVWGEAAPGEKVTVTCGAEHATATAGSDGHWSLKLAAMKPGRATTMTIQGDKTKKPLKFGDVLIGDVWIASGQSNMGFQVKQAANAEAEIARAHFPQIRFFRTVHEAATQPTRAKLAGAWVVVSPKTVGEMSAVAYFFSRDVFQLERVSIGILGNSWGGMPAESFVSEGMLKSDPAFEPLLKRKAERMAAGDSKGDSPSLASNIYNAMVYPIIPYAMKGVIWYQGESNAGRAMQYRKLFPALIRDWRAEWKQGDFPFLFVQLAAFGNGHPPATQPADSTWAELREAQSMTLSVPNTAQALAIDIGAAKNIHPKDKQDVGHRLALAAEKLAYGKDIEWSGPVYRRMAIEGHAIRLYFDHAGGLHARGGEPTGFQIAGADHQWRWAEASVDGDEMVVSSDAVASPVAVRYGWADDPKVNMYNSDELPMSPFRTDDWAH